MKSKTEVGQIYLTHPKDANYTSLYEEAFTKHGQAVELFVVLEITGGANLHKLRKTEYEQLTQALVTAFKRTYVTAVNLDQETFEQALAAINATLSRLAGKGRVSWYNKLNAAIGAIFQNHLALSTTGSALVYLARGKELNLLSESLGGETARPVKIFSNYAAGRLVDGDRIIFTTSQLGNYLSLDRLREFLKEQNLEDVCQEILGVVQDIKTVGFASFVCEFVAGPNAGVSKDAATMASPALAKVKRPGVFIPAAETAEGSFSRAAGRYALSVAKFLWNVLVGIIGGLTAFLINFFRHRPKKYLFAAMGIVLLLLALSIGGALWKKTAHQKQAQVSSSLDQINKILSDAEGALIYKDEARATALLTQAEQELNNVPGSQGTSQRQTLTDRIQALKNKLTHEVRVDNPTQLTAFPTLPSDLLYSPNGFLGFNRDSETLAFYDFRTAATKPLLQNQNTSKLLQATYFGGAQDYIFLDRDGKFESLDLQNNQLPKLSATTTPIIDLTAAKIQAIATLGEGSLARLYLLDTTQNQLWRVRATAKGLLQPAEKWLTKETPNFSTARDLAVDGSVYVLFPDHVDKYFNGQKQSFTLAPVAPALQNAVKIFTLPNYQFLYILDPANQRILVFNKQGKFDHQITSGKFRDLADIYVDEKNKIMYVLSGSTLLQIGL